MDFLKKAYELKGETVKHRRFFHENAEAGLDEPKTEGYIFEELERIGLTPSLCGKGVVATIGKGSPVGLLRADMDALPMKEESELEFASKTNCAHTCGHDFHAAMLLTAAKILKLVENNLKGTVKFMFEPAEETLEGARNMLDSGLFNEPTPDFALSFHTGAGKIPVGTIMYNEDSVMMYSADRFEIRVKGRGGHGAIPHLNADPIKTAVNIYKALEEICENEKDILITIGKFKGGDTDNIIPNEAKIGGTLRTDNKENRSRILRDIKNAAENIAKENKCTVEFIINATVPPLICNRDFTRKVVSYIRELNIPEFKEIPNIKATASDDFALITDKISSAYIYLACGFEDQRGEYTAHHPKVQFNEDVLPIGAACFAYCASKLLK